MKLKLTKSLYRWVQRLAKGNMNFADLYTMLLLPLFAVAFALDYGCGAIVAGSNANANCPETRDPYGDPRSSYYGASYWEK